MTSPSSDRMTDLIPRAEALRRVRDKAHDLMRETADEENANALWRTWRNGANEILADLEAIPAIGTCATCDWAKSGRSPDGDTALECINRPFQLDLSMLGRVRIWVDPDHFCAAYKPKEGAK